MMKTKKVIILDDHTLFLKGMTLILKECCAGCEVFAYKSIKKLKAAKHSIIDFDILISDIELPGEDTFEFFASIKRTNPELPILVVSMHKKNAILKKCRAIGINGYLLKNEDEQLTNAIESILAGKDYFSKTITDFCKKTGSTFLQLSNRENEIIKLIGNGFHNQDIANKLFLSVETIKTHKKNIKLKLNVKDDHGIIEFAKKTYLI